MAIRLDTIEGIPAAFLRDLRRSDNLLRGCECVEQLLRHQELRRIVTELDQLCEAQGIVGYHYTRATPELIGTRGLLTSCGEDRRADFIETYGHLFSAAQLQRVQRMWSDYFNEHQVRLRDGRVWFNFTLTALDNGGAERLLTYFGGEQVYMPLTEDRQIAAILRTIGEPLIVECELNPASLHTYSQTPWGAIWLSSYHVRVNKEAMQHDVDSYLQESVLPSRILRIWPAPRRDSARRPHQHPAWG